MGLVAGHHLHALSVETSAALNLSVSWATTGERSTACLGACRGWTTLSVCSVYVTAVRNAALNVVATAASACHVLAVTCVSIGLGVIAETVANVLIAARCTFAS